MEQYANILGFKKVIDFFGYWPSFHDAEVISMKFNRDHIFEMPGPSLIVRLHAFEMTPEVNEKGFYKTIKHCVITFEFDNVELLEFKGFNHQNAIFELEFEDGNDNNSQPIKKVNFKPAFGVECKFQCRAVLVSNIEEGVPNNVAHT